MDYGSNHVLFDTEATSVNVNFIKTHRFCFAASERTWGWTKSSFGVFSSDMDLHALLDRKRCYLKAFYW